MSLLLRILAPLGSRLGLAALAWLLQGIAARVRKPAEPTADAASDPSDDDPQQTIERQ